MKMNEQTVLSISSGLMAGLGTTLTLVAVPAMLQSSDPLPVWKRTYKNGTKIALSTIMVSTLTGIRCYFITEDWRYLLVAGSSMSIALYTLLIMKPTNNQLSAIENGDKSKDGRVRQLIEKWGKMQTVRTLLGLGAFFVNLTIVHH